MAKFESLSYIDKVFGMAFFTTRNEEKVVGVKEAGELQHINYDQYKSLVYILNNGTVSRTTVEHPDIASLELVTETYPLSVVIYSQGLENVNCESASQSIAQGIKKALSGKQPDLIDAINADNVTIRITATDLDKDAVWKSQTSLPNALTEKDILIAVDFEVTITGDEQCFAGEPCEAPEFVFDYAAEPLCTKVNECLGISASGSTTKFLNERGQFVEVLTGTSWGSITGTLSNQTDLQNALNAKLTAPGGTTSQYIRGDGTLATFPTNLSQFTNGPGYLTANQTITLSGDVSGSGTTAITTTLATVNAAPGTYGSGSTIPQITVNAKGLVTSVNLFNNTPDFGYITNLPTTISGYGITDTTAQLLTGLSITGSTIASSDSILSAFGKLQNQINGVLGGAIYQGTWNASTNSPSLVSGTGTKGYYYVVSVAGSTNLDGVTDWNVGDWAIYNGTAWQKVDNTDAVSSVNSAIGAVTITVTGTANRISVTGGSGLAPTVDISASYVGQTSITTLGTVTTGTLSTGAIIGGVTMTLGSDAANDIYYRNGSGVLTRLANGTTGQYLGATTGSAPSWSTPSSTITWNSISNPTGTQSLTFDDGELNDWTINSDTETFHTWTHNSLTTGTTQLLTTSSITTGKLLSLVSTSTGANAFSLLNITSSGANANSSRTATGANISVTNTGTTSTNIGLNVVASGATNNYAALFDGRVGIGTTTPAYPLHVKMPTGYLRGINLEMDLSGGGSTVLGQYINATGVVPNTNCNRFGLYSDLYTNISYTGIGATRNTYAVAGLVRGSGSGTSAYGGYFIANGDGGSGTTYGIYSETTNTGSSFSYAGYFKNSNVNPFSRYGVYSLVDGGGGSASTTYGVYSSANTSNNGTAYGVYGTTNNNSQSGANYYGGMFTTAGASLNSFGVRASATGAATNNYGGYFTATGASNNYGLIVSAGLAGISVTAPTALLHVAASTTAAASLRIAASTNSPSSPNDGDVWYLDTNDRLMFRKASNSVEILSASTATTEIVVPDTTLTITYNGTTYKLLAKA